MIGIIETYASYCTHAHKQIDTYISRYFFFVRFYVLDI